MLFSLHLFVEAPDIISLSDSGRTLNLLSLIEFVFLLTGRCTLSVTLEYLLILF